MKINSSIFKEYDIRGEYPKEINEKVVYKIAQGFVKFLKLKPKDNILVSRDKRRSSPSLLKAFISGITDLGINIIDIGIVDTPLLYFAVPFLKAKGGAMITASHNPEEDNGIKFVREKSEPIGGQEIKRAFELIKEKVKISRAKDKKGTSKKLNIEKDYLRAMLGGFKLNKKIPISYSFDYDGDRLIIKDENDKEIRGDIIGGIIGDSILKKGDIIVYDLRCSHRIPEYFQNKGIITVPCRVGRPNIERIMREKKAVFGIELVGHYHFKKFNYCLSPLYALRILIERIKKNGKSLNELIKPFLKYHHSGVMNFKIKEGIFEKIIKKLEEEYKNGAQNYLDGLTVEFSNWWFNIRPSKTEPLARLVIEAKTPNLLDTKKKELLKKIKTS